MPNTIRFSWLIVVALMISSCGNEPNQPAPGTSKVVQEKSESATATNVTGDAEKGKAKYATCASCHGAKGEGLQALMAPALAGQEPYYLRNQLENFNSGKRPHEQDDNGAMMGSVAKTLNPEEINDVIAYITALPAPTISPTIEGGDVEKGKTYYNMICGACHGPGAMGVEALFSPKLIGLQDWYLELQINNFREGKRGTAEGDAYGAQMHQIATAIPDDETVKDLIAYLNSLNAE